MREELLLDYYRGLEVRGREVRGTFGIGGEEGFEDAFHYEI